MSISSVASFRRLRRATGSISPAKFGGYKGFALAAHEDLVRHLIAEQPDITLAELTAVLATEKVTVAQSSIFPRDRLSGAGLKPVRAAAVKSRGGERRIKSSDQTEQVSVRKTNESEPSDDASL